MKSPSHFYGGVFDWDQALHRFDELNALAEEQAIWEDPAEAQKLMRERARLEESIKCVREFEATLKDTVELASLARDDQDDELAREAGQALQDLKDKAEQAELEALLSGEADDSDCYVEIHPGAGGTEAQDWASMMMRMYVRWAQERGFKTDIVEEHPGEEAGLKSATLLIKGEKVYGWLKTESGVHRLVRISPFDSNARRHTSFASVWVYPHIDDSIEIDIQEKDCRVDTYRASGAGGQHINKTDSAVRITHLPTGIVVQCQNQRSQHKNRAAAWDMLRARLYELELRKREAEAQAEEDSKSEIGWGRQIRSYVLQPYQLVKDLRTGFETSNTQGVLNGELDPFMSAVLSQRAEQGEAGS